jgi:hypothetical protein
MSASVSRAMALLRTAEGRLRTWGTRYRPEGEESTTVQDLLVQACDKSKIAVRAASDVGACVQGLVDASFHPPKRSFASAFAVGDPVAVRPKYRPKYQSVYEKQLEEDPEMLDRLVVVRTDVPGGEIVVQRRKFPFMVCKSHLRLRK